MKNKTVTLFVIISLSLLSFRLHAQAQTTPPMAGSSQPETTGVRSDIKRSIAENDRQYRERTARVDVKQLEKDARQTPKGNSLTGKQKAWIVLGIVALAALVFAVVKYGKDCRRYEPAGCSPSTDDNCTCAEYEQNR